MPGKTGPGVFQWGGRIGEETAACVAGEATGARPRPGLESSGKDPPRELRLRPSEKKCNPTFHFSVRLRCAGLGDPGLVTEGDSRHSSVLQPLLPLSRAEASGCRGVAWRVRAAPMWKLPEGHPQFPGPGRCRWAGGDTWAGGAAVATQSDSDPPTARLPPMLRLREAGGEISLAAHRHLLAARTDGRGQRCSV